jgi:hypothetical protein
MGRHLLSARSRRSGYPLIGIPVRAAGKSFRLSREFTKVKVEALTDDFGGS